MNATHTRTDNLLMALGVASFVLYPLTAIPGIVLGKKRKAELSPRGQLGYGLCFVSLGLFFLHVIAVGALLFQGMANQ